VTLQLSPYYAEALAVLKERENDTSFPAGHYQLNAIRAIIADERGKQRTAQRHAMAALKAAAKTHSGFRYHPNIGLVDEKASRVHVRLEQIVQS
jgi:hypothetical protein